MKYQLTSAVGAVLLLFMFYSCSGSVAEPLFSPMDVSTVSAEALWTRITEESDYKVYGEWTAHSGLNPGQSPHGVWHRVFGNRTLFEALPAADSRAPDGSIVIKENYDNNKTLKNLTVMTKVKDFDPDNGDWYWAMFDAEGTVLNEGSLMGCISCHEGMRDNDYVIINPLNEEP